MRLRLAAYLARPVRGLREHARAATRSATSDYGGDEPHYLLTAKSLVDDGDFDVRNQRADRDWEEFYPYYLDRHGKLTEGHAHEPHGAGFPALIAPAFALGGAKAVELFLAAIAALGGVLAYLLALRVVPDPWAIGATLAVTLSPPFLAYGSAVYPELAAGDRARGRGAARAAAAGRDLAQRGGRLLPAARHAAVARHEVRAGGRRDRRLRRADAVAHAAPDARAAQLRARALQRHLLRHAERGALRRADAVLGRRRGRDGDRRELPRRLPRPRLPAGRALHRPRVRPAALGAGVPARGRGRSGCSCARGARGSPARCRSTRAPRRPRCSARSRWARSSWSRRSSPPRCSASGSPPGTCWPGCCSPCRSSPGACAASRGRAGRWR